MRARLASSCAVMASRCVRAASSSACAALRSAASMPFSAVLASSCIPRRAACATAASRSARTSAEIRLGRRHCGRQPSALRLGLHARRIDVRVRLDRRVEVAVDGVRPLGLAPQIAAQPLGLGQRVGELRAQPLDLAVGVAEVPPHSVGLRPRVGQLGAQGVDLTVRLRQLAADGCRLGLRLRQVRALRFGLRLGFGEVGQQDVGLGLYLGQRDRQPLAALAFATQLLVRRVERGLGVRARLFGRGVRRARVARADPTFRRARRRARPTGVRRRRPWRRGGRGSRRGPFRPSPGRPSACAPRLRLRAAPHRRARAPRWPRRDRGRATRHARFPSGAGPAAPRPGPALRRASPTAARSRRAAR